MKRSMRDTAREGHWWVRRRSSTLYIAPWIHHWSIRSRFVDLWREEIFAFANVKKFSEIHACCGDGNKRSCCGEEVSSMVSYSKLAWSFCGINYCLWQNFLQLKEVFWQPLEPELSLKNHRFLNRAFILQEKLSTGFFHMRSTCRKCGGQGHVVKDPCRKCHGSGSVMETKTITVPVPAGENVY